MEYSHYWVHGTARKVDMTTVEVAVLIKLPDIVDQEAQDVAIPTIAEEMVRNDHYTSFQLLRVLPAAICLNGESFEPRDKQIVRPGQCILAVNNTPSWMGRY